MDKVNICSIDKMEQIPSNDIQNNNTYEDGKKEICNSCQCRHLLYIFCNPWGISLKKALLI